LKNKLYLKRILYITIFCFSFVSSFSQQYYLRGEIKDESNNSIGKAKILLHSNNYVYSPDTSGVFEILIKNPEDSVTISADGYKSMSVELEAGQYQYIILNLLYNPNSPAKQLFSFTKNKPFVAIHPGVDDLSGLLIENSFSEANKYPETFFAVNPDKISYDNFKRYINLNTTIPSDGLRIEEMLNYFNLDYHEPAADSNFSFSSFLTKCPWNEKEQLLLCHLNVQKKNLDEIPSANLVFLIDASGSMALPNRLPMLKSAMHLLVNSLREIDTISIITYGTTTSVLLAPTPGNRKKDILDAIEQLHPGGSLSGDIAIKDAYTIAENQFVRDGNNRIILATDGDFNIGEITQEELEKTIMMHKRWGIYLSCLAMGMGNKRETKLQVLSERGGGNISYINDQKNAEKALMREFAQVDYSFADSAFFTIRLDSNLVSSYRLVGYENKINALQDTTNQPIGGEVSSGSAVMALFEIKPSPDSVRRFFMGQSIGELGFNYRTTANKAKKFAFFVLPAKEVSFSSLPSSYQFASAVAWCSLLMKKSPFTINSKWRDALNLVNHSYNNKDIFQKEFMQLIEQAKKIYAKAKRDE